MTTIRQKIASAKRNLQNDMLRDWLKAEIFYMDAGNNVNINGYCVSHIDIDQYGNFSCGFMTSNMPPKVMRMYAKLLRFYLQDYDGFKGRAAEGFLIEYFQHYPKISVELIREMIKIDRRYGESPDISKGFKDWLIGNSFSEGGNAEYYERNDLYEALKE